MSDAKRVPKPTDQVPVLTALSEGPISAPNLARRHRWHFVAVCNALDYRQKRGHAERVNGVWRLTDLGIAELGRED